jgi:predicted nucleic acid-binding protein
MTVVLDTSFLAAFVNPDDPLHSQAYEAMGRMTTGELGMPVTSEHVLAEGLALLQRRPRRVAVSRSFVAMFTGRAKARPAVQLRRTTREDLGRATDLHFTHFDRGLSLVDCILLGLAQDVDAHVATFDRGFRGLVPLMEGLG